MIITISGRAGSGKSTVGKMLAKRLGLKYISIGEIRRKVAEYLEISITELNKLSETDGRYDVLVDNFQKEIADGYVLDSRLGFYFKPESVKVFITVDYSVAARRVFSDMRDAECFSSVDDARKELESRDEEDSNRYLKRYSVNHLDTSHYDLVIDSSCFSPEDVVESIVTFLKENKLL